MSQFVKEETEKFVKIRCPALLDAAAAKDFTEQSKAWMLSKAPHFVIDLNGVTSITRDFYQAVIQLKTNLKRTQKSVYSVNATANVLKQIKTDGVDLAFNPVNSIDLLMNDKTSTPSNNGFNVAIINPFLAATQKTLEVQCHTKVTPLKPLLKTAPLPNIAIAGVLSLVSNEYSGSIVLCFSQQVFLKIYENMFGEKHDKITQEIEDAAGELLNIIYGTAKIELNPKGFNFQKALPTVMTGDKISVRQASSKPAMIIPFEMESGQFHIEIEFNKSIGGN